MTNCKVMPSGKCAYRETLGGTCKEGECLMGSGPADGPTPSLETVIPTIDMPGRRPSFGVTVQLENPKDIAGKGKPQLHLIPMPALLEVAKAMASGAVKYGPYNWREKKITPGAYISAGGRHAGAYFEGQDLDPESGLHHLAHDIASKMILLDAILCGMVNDDRPSALFPKEPAHIRDKVVAWRDAETGKTGEFTLSKKGA